MSEFHPIPYGYHTIEDDDIEIVAEVLRSPLITTGPMAARFEQELAQKVGAQYAVVCSSGTAALHIACLASGLTTGDEVITSPITFIASSNAALYVGAKAAFVDVQQKTACMDPEALRQYLTRKRGKEAIPRAVIPVHYAGLPCDMKSIFEIAREHGLFVIEDACHALGAEYLADGVWHKTGSCAHSDMTVFSFHPVKHITTGEGGAITTNDENLYIKLLEYRNHGITRRTECYTNHDMSEDGQGGVNPWYYEMVDLGFNYRLTDFQCALGINQLAKLNRFIDIRRKIAEIYDEAFSNIPEINIPPHYNDKKHVYHLYAISVDFYAIKKTRAHFMSELQERGVGTQVHYIPVHLQRYYRERYGYGRGNFPVAESFYERELSIPIFPKLVKEDQERVIESITGCITGAD